MRKLFIALVAAVTIAGSVVAISGRADAHWRGGAVAAGVVGGLAADDLDQLHLVHRREEMQADETLRRGAGLRGTTAEPCRT